MSLSKYIFRSTIQSALASVSQKPLTPEEATQAVEKFHAAYPEVAKWKEQHRTNPLIQRSTYAIEYAITTTGCPDQWYLFETVFMAPTREAVIECCKRACELTSSTRARILQCVGNERRLVYSYNHGTLLEETNVIDV